MTSHPALQSPIASVDATILSSEVSPPKSRIWRALHRTEDVLLALVLAGVVLVPIIDMLLRQLESLANRAREGDWYGGNLHFGFTGANTLTQQLTLLIGIFGGVVAARELRLLSLTHGFANARRPWGQIFEIIRAAMSVGVSAILAWVGYQFFLSEKGDGRMLIGSVPLWISQSTLGIGFALVAIRLLIHAGHGAWVVRIVGGILAGLLVALVLGMTLNSGWPATVLLLVLIVSVVLGAPIFVLLGGAAIFLFWRAGEPLAIIALDHYNLSTNSTIPALPLFTLAGYFLAEGGTSKRMFRLLRSLVGGFHAGPALVTVLACAFFTSLTGASGVTILALGGLLVPFLVESRYSERDALGFLTGAGSVGMLFAPCLPLILYAIVASQAGASVDIKQMFLGGVGPGVVFVVATVAWGTWRRPHATAVEAAWSFDGREAWDAAWDAKWELLIPVISLGTIFGGLATPVEAAAVTALFSCFIEVVVYHDLKIRDLVKVTRECGMLMGGVLLMLGVAQGFTDYLTTEQIPDQLVAFAKAHIASKIAFLLLLNVVLLFVGCVMEVFQAIIVVAPLLVPIGREFDIDPIHLGVLFLANLELGFMMPPVGMNLLLAGFRFKKSMTEVLRAVAPFLVPQFAVVLLIAYWPKLSTYLPNKISKIEGTSLTITDYGMVALIVGVTATMMALANRRRRAA